MAMPTGIGIIDTMIGFPHDDMKQVYDFITRQTKDRESKEDFEFPVEYMFKDVPEKDYRDVDDPIAVTLHEMDRWGIEKGLIGVGEPSGVGELALKRHPDRFVPRCGVDPNEGMEAIRKIVRAYEDVRHPRRRHVPGGHVPAGRASTTRRCTRSTPSAWSSTSRCSAAPACPGRACRCEPQHVELHRRGDVRLPRARVRHPPRLRAVGGPRGEAHAQVAGPALLARARSRPKHYPKAIIDYANTRGADKIIYAGYFPMGLSLERIMTEMPNVPFKDEVWPKFLRENTLRVLGLDK